MPPNTVTRQLVSPSPQTQFNRSSVQPPPQVQCRLQSDLELDLVGMPMLSDSSLTGGVDQGSALPATPPPLLDTVLSGLTVAASQGQLTPEGRISSTTGFVDARTGLILAVVLCALVGVLSLHPLLRCMLYYCGRRSRALPVADPPVGLKKSVLRKMPVAVYEAEAPGAPAGGAECAICLGEFADGDAVRLLPRCRHGFHVPCIDTWLSAHSSCPICRDSLLDEGATAAGEETTVGRGRNMTPRAWMYPEFTIGM